MMYSSAGVSLVSLNLTVALPASVALTSIVPEPLMRVNYVCTQTD